MFINEPISNNYIRPIDFYYKFVKHGIKSGHSDAVDYAIHIYAFYHIRATVPRHNRNEGFIYKWRRH